MKWWRSVKLLVSILETLNIKSERQSFPSYLFGSARKAKGQQGLETWGGGEGHRDSTAAHVNWPHLMIWGPGKQWETECGPA